MNVFIPKLKHYHWLMGLMIKYSKSLIFVNKAYRDVFKSKYPKLYEKTNNPDLIFNGVDSFWLDNMQNMIQSDRYDTLIYVGAFNENKNIKSSRLAS